MSFSGVGVFYLFIRVWKVFKWDYLSPQEKQDVMKLDYNAVPVPLAPIGLAFQIHSPFSNFGVVV
jgi:hypothetical protein